MSPNFSSRIIQTVTTSAIPAVTATSAQRISGLVASNIPSETPKFWVQRRSKNGTSSITPRSRSISGPLTQYLIA